MIVTRVFPGSPLPVDLGETGAREQIVELYRPPREPFVRINLISSVSGSAGGTDGTSETLSNPVDRTILGVIREHGDVVVIGAQSLRAEGYLLPRRVPLAVVTSSGNLAGHGTGPTGATGNVIVVCPPSAVDRVHETSGDMSIEILTIDTPDGRLAIADIIEALAARGLTSIVCEGGPGLAAQFLEAGVVDEVCLSTSPVINGSALPVFGTDDTDQTALRINQLMVDDASGIYARWGVIR